MNQFEGVIHPSLWQQPTFLDELQKENLASEPYLHTVLNPLCDREFLRNVHDEVREGMKANFKETDLFKVFQTAELGSLEEESLEKEMPHLLKLRKVLYSKDFRQMIAKITNCREDLNEVLTDRVDCSINAYANSCHLLCHDDVIGTRCVSYIIYLPNPDEEWTAEDGGAVELYPLDPKSVISLDLPQNIKQEQGIPVVNPTKCLLPTFNSMLVFKVQPGKSYHSVQEVFNKSSPRISISGWYHAAQPPMGSDNSSLKQIMKYGDDQSPIQPLSFPVEPSLPLPSNGNPFTEEEMNFLTQFIASEYLQLKNLKKLQKNFIQHSSVQLQQFLKKDLFDQIQSQLILQDRKDQLGKGKPSLDYLRGVQDGWEVIGPPHKRRYLSFMTPDHNHSTNNDSSLLVSIGNFMKQCQQQLFTHPAFKKWLTYITTIETITGMKSEVRRFRPGLDYTVAHYGIITREPWLDMTLTFVNDDKEVEEIVVAAAEKKDTDNGKKRKKNSGLKLKSLKKKQKEQKRPEDDEEDARDTKEANDEDDYASDYGELWEDGDVGGFECFIEADDDADDAEAAEVYRQKKETGKEGEETKEDGDDTTLLSLSACSNSLSLVLRDEGIMKFVKYVSANAPGSRWDVSVEYAIEIAEGEEEDVDEEEDDDEEEEEDN